MIGQSPCHSRGPPANSILYQPQRAPPKVGADWLKRLPSVLGAGRCGASLAPAQKKGRWPGVDPGDRAAHACGKDGPCGVVHRGQRGVHSVQGSVRTSESPHFPIKSYQQDRDANF